jgi:glycosyltransferase involved in cell wall biosynthesis
MRILFITPYFAFKQGGVSEVVYQLATRLSQKGHQVTLLTSNYLEKEETQTSFTFEIIRMPSFSHWGFYVTPSLLPWLKNNLKQFDIVHLQEFRTFQNIIATFFSRYTNTPFVFSAHGTMPNIIEKRLLKSLFDIFFKGLILKYINTFIAVSPKEIEHYLQAGIPKDKIELILNGLNVKEFIHPSKRTSNNNAKSQTERKKIVYVGRIHKLKRIDRLVTAFSLISKQYHQAQLMIAGPDNGELSNLHTQARKLGISDRVSFPGPIFGKKKVAFYQSADVLAYPSSHEIFGLVPFEALLCGTPVVVTANTGMGDLIRQAGAGQTVTQDDSQALADALLWVLENPQAAQKQVTRGQKFIKENLDWSIISRQYEMLYQKFLAD